MKRFAALLLALSLLLSASCALADGELTISQPSFFIIDDYIRYGCAFARVENTSDIPIRLDDGLFEIYDSNGNLLASEDYLYTYLVDLAPGQHTYIAQNAMLEDDVDTATCVLTISGNSDDVYKVIMLPCEAEYKPNVTVRYWTGDYMYVTYTNNTDQLLYDISAMLALLDEAGNVLWVESDYLYSDRALHPGSSMTVRIEIDPVFMDYFEANGIVPASVDAIVYVEIEE